MDTPNTTPPPVNYDHLDDSFMAVYQRRKLLEHFKPDEIKALTLVITDNGDKLSHPVSAADDELMQLWVNFQNVMPYVAKPITLQASNGKRFPLEPIVFGAVASEHKAWVQWTLLPFAARNYLINQVADFLFSTEWSVTS